MATETVKMEVAWEGEVNGDVYRVVEYNGMAWAIEWCCDGAWRPVSYGSEADAPECAVVAAHLASLLSDAQAALEAAREEGRREAEIRSVLDALGRLQEAGYYLHNRKGQAITAEEYVRAVTVALAVPEGSVGG